MAVGYVASASSGSQASVASFNIGTLGTGARAGIVFVCTHNSSTAKDTGVTWNGVAMSLLYSATDTDTEPGVVRAYFLDNVSNGTITVSRTNDATVTVGYAASISASGMTEVAQTITRVSSTQNTNANTSTTGTGSAVEVSVDDGSVSGTNSMRFAACFSGLSTPATAGANSTSLQVLDSTSYGSRFVRETTAGTGSRSVGFTGSADDFAAVFVAVREAIRPSTGALTLPATTVSGTGEQLVNPAGTGALTLPATTVSGTATHLAAYVEGVLSLEPLAYWPCDEASGNLADATGNGWTGTKAGAGSVTYQASGPTIASAAQSAVEVDGSSYFTTSTSMPDASASTGRTLMAWVYLPSTSSASGRFLSKQATNQSEASLQHASDGTGLFNAYQSDGNTVVAQASSTDLDGGSWHHLLGWWDPADQDCYIQVDGNTPVTGAGSTDIKTDSTSSYGIAATSAGGNALRSGSRLAHVAIFDRVLTSGERASLYSGDFETSATGALTLPAITASGTGSQAMSATGALTTPAATVSGTATAANPATATGALTLASAVISGTATETFSATGALTGRSITIVGTGAETFSGSGALAGQPIAVSGTGSEAFTSTGAVVLTAAVIAGSGTHVVNPTGTGAVVLGPPAIVGTGEYVTNDVSATGAILLASSVVSGAGTEAFTSTGSLTTPSATVSGAGTEAMTATGAIITVAPTLDGTGVLAFSGTGALTLSAAQVVAAASMVPSLTATGAVALPGVVISGAVDNSAYVPPVGGGYYRRQPLPKPKLPTFTGEGALYLGASRIAGRGTHSDDELVLGLLLGLSDDALIGAI